MALRYNLLHINFYCILVNIVHQTQSSFALVFEFAFGGELYNRMKTEHKMSESQAKFYFCEIALALHYLHDEKKIVYRSIIPFLFKEILYRNILFVIRKGTLNQKTFSLTILAILNYAISDSLLI